MTLNKYDRFAIIPTRCDRCGRLFIFEGYDLYYREVGIEKRSIKCVKCKCCNYPMDYLLKDITELFTKEK